MKVLLIRHGESIQNTKENFELRLPDHSVYLTAKGKEEADKAGKFLKEYCKSNNIDLDNSILWLSPFKRTRQTKDIINSHLNISRVIEDTSIVEQSYGVCSLFDKDEMRKQYPYEFKLRDACYENEGKFYAKYPLGESPFDVAMRTKFFIEELYREGDKTHFVISHGVAIRTIVMNLMHYTVEWYNKEINPSNCSIRLIDPEILVDEYIYNKPKVKVKK